MAPVRSWETVPLALRNGLVEAALRRLKGKGPRVDMGGPGGCRHHSQPGTAAVGGDKQLGRTCGTGGKEGQQ